MRIDPAPTATALSSTADPSVTGEPVTLTAQVSTPRTPFFTRPDTGTVTFRDGAAVLCRDVAPPFGSTYTCGLPNGLSTGGHDLTATFSGTPLFAGSTGALPQTVGRAPTATTLTSSAPVSADLGAPVTFTAAVAVPSPGAGTPTGTVQFAVDGRPAGDPVPLGSGGATSPPVSGLAPGAHAVTAAYSGDGGYADSRYEPLTQQVDAGAVTITGLYSTSLNVTRDTVLRGATVTGPVTVQPGASLAVDGSTITGSLRSTGAAALRLCGTAVTGPVAVSGSSGPVLLGDSGAHPWTGCLGDS